MAFCDQLIAKANTLILLSVWLIVKSSKWDVHQQAGQWLVFVV